MFMQRIYDFFDTPAGAACVGGFFAIGTMIGVSLILWPERVGFLVGL